MHSSRKIPNRKSTTDFGFKGYTLVEILIAITIGIVLIASVYTVYSAQVRSHRHQQLIMEAQQNLRGAMVIMANEVRMAGYDPMESGAFGIVDVRRYHEIESSVVDPDGQPALFYTADMDENGDLDTRNANRNREHPNFRIRYDRKIQRRYLAWDLGGGRQPLAESIHAMGLAYAVDTDSDGAPDRWNDGPHLIWAVDTDNDNRLDVHLDTNDDGRIDVRDDRNNDGRIDGPTVDNWIRPLMWHASRRCGSGCPGGVGPSPGRPGTRRQHHGGRSSCPGRHRRISAAVDRDRHPLSQPLKRIASNVERPSRYHLDRGHDGPFCPCRWGFCPWRNCRSAA